MRKFILIFIIIISNIITKAQQIDSIIKSEKKIVIFPFNTKLYYNDAEIDIASNSKLNHIQILNYFRQEFDNSLIKFLNDTCIAVSALKSYTINGDNSLEEIYSISNYSYSKAMDYTEEKKSLYNTSKLAVSEKEKNKIEKNKNKKYGGEVVSTIVDNTDKFIHVTFKDKESLKEVSSQYSADYMLFINQFEILGNYSSPYDIEKVRNNMLIKVHYSIYTFNGKYIFGSFASAEYPVYIIEMKEIKEIYFPLIIKQIIKNIPLEIPKIKNK